MNELQRSGMQEVPRQGSRARARPQFARCTVESVADDGMTDGGEMNANLMSASGIDLQFEQTELAEGGIKFLADGVVGDGFAPSAAPGGHAGSAHNVAA